MMISSGFALWNDRRGSFSVLRAVTLIALLLPISVLLFDALTDNLGPRPFTEALHRTGLWTVRFLMITLLVTPMRRLARYPQLVDARRMLGVGSFCYIALHLTLYCFDQAWDLGKVASEIALRIYLTIGFIAWLGLATLAVTSNDAMVRRLGGRRWRRLHMLVYPIGVLALTHYFMQAKLEVFEPTVVAGLFVWLMLYRIAHWTLAPRLLAERGEFSLWIIGLIGVAAGIVTFLGEAVGFWAVYGASIPQILNSNWNFASGPRPGWYVMMGGAIVLAVAIVRLKRHPAAVPTP